jgi:hypothetical protein
MMITTTLYGITGVLFLICHTSNVIYWVIERPWFLVENVNTPLAPELFELGQQ